MRLFQRLHGVAIRTNRSVEHQRAHDCNFFHTNHARNSDRRVTKRKVAHKIDLLHHDTKQRTSPISEQ